MDFFHWLALQSWSENSSAFILLESEHIWRLECKHIGCQGNFFVQLVFQAIFIKARI